MQNCHWLKVGHVTANSNTCCIVNVLINQWELGSVNVAQLY